MQQMSEFVEDGFHFAMRQQRWRVVNRRRQIAANESEMGLATIRIAGDERVHPGAAALVLARKPVRVEAAQKLARRSILHPVIFDCRIPAGTPGSAITLMPKNAAEDIEHAGHHSIQFKVGPQLLFIEIVKRQALFFGQVADVPGLDVCRSPALLPNSAGSVFSLEERLGLFAADLQETLALCSPVCAMRSSSTRSAKSR